MTERSTCFLRQPQIGLPTPVNEDVILDVQGDGIHLVFSVANPGGAGYAQERFFYSWKNSTFAIYTGGLLVISGVPEETVDRIPLVIAQEGNCRLVNRSEYTVAVKLSEKSSEAVQEALRRRGGNKC